MATVVIKDSLTDDQARVIGGVLQTSGSGGGGGGSTDLIAVGGDPITLGQVPSANSLPVVLASDQSPIEVIVSGPTETPVFVYASQASVAVGVQTSIVSYTAPSSSPSAYFQFAKGSGQNVAQWIVDDNGTIIDQSYTNPAALNTEFDFFTGIPGGSSYPIPAGHTITVSVIQIGPDAANFNARIQVTEVS